MRAEGRAGEGRKEGGKERRGGGGGEPGRSDYESAEASLGRRRPQPTRRCSPGDGGTRRAAAVRRGHRAVRGGCGGERAAPPPRGAPGKGLPPCRCPEEAVFISSSPPRRGEALGPGRATGRGGGGTVAPEPLTSAGAGRCGQARASRRDSLRICVEISSLPFFLFPGARLHFFL